MYRAAARILANEVKAGHYIVQNTCVIYHGGANFDPNDEETTDADMEYWYDSMIRGFQDELAKDFDGDGVVEELGGIGFVPSNPGIFDNDKPINYYLAATNQYPNVFVVSKGHYLWRTDALLQECFPPIDYPTQSESVVMPKGTRDLLARDGSHLNQCGYNAAGLVLAENLYGYFRTERALESVQLLNRYGSEVQDEIVLWKTGATERFILLTEPCYVSDLTIILSDNLQMLSPFTVKATAAGEGFITITYQGEVLRHVIVTVGE